MRFNEHSLLADKHSFLSPSYYHWLNYTDDRLEERYITHLAAKRGTELHEFAKEAIRLGVKLRGNSTTLALYVNDAIAYGMQPEQVLYYSDNCFGTADAISFSNSKLRIHDLKTGKTVASEKQLEVYAAIFCLEYGFTPFDISIELRIYQDDEVRVYDADPDTIAHIMDKIVIFDEKLELLKTQV